MPRDYKAFLGDVLISICDIRGFVAGFTLEPFAADKKTTNAVLRSLEIIGEAVKNVPDDVRSRYPAVEWRFFTGLRDVLIHRYFGVDFEIVWDIVQNKLPVLEERIKEILR